MASHGTRKPVTTAQKRSEALAARAEALKSGKRRLDQIKIDDELVYDSLSEGEYAEVVQNRSSRSFIVEDGHGHGYDDDGEENWDCDDPGEYEARMKAHDDEILRANRPPAGDKKGARKRKMQEIVPLSVAFLAGPQARAIDEMSDITQRRKTHSTNIPTVDVTELLNDLVDRPNDDILNNAEENVLGVNVENIALYGQSHEIKRVQESKIQESISHVPVRSDEEFKPHIKQEFCVESLFSNECKDDSPGAVLVKNLVSEAATASQFAQNLPNISSISLKPKVYSPVNPATSSSANWFTGSGTAEQTPSATAHIEASELVSSSGSLQFFWLDATEDAINAPGRIYLFGKAWVRDSDRYSSCCVVVNNIMRNIFILPRSHHLNDPDTEVEIADVYAEFRELASRHNIGKWMSKEVQRKYAFHNDEDGSIPAESNYLKVVYSFEMPVLPRDISGNTFSHIFGTKTSALETFLLKADLMGPQWLQIDNVRQNDRPHSWCKSEFVVDSLKSLSKLEDIPSPTLSVLSLSISVHFNPVSRANELLAVSCFVHNSVDIEVSTANPSDLHLFSVIAPIKGQQWPPDLEANVKARRLPITVCPSERALLSFLIAKLHQLDPDVIVGHQLFGFIFDVLMARLSHHCISGWSKLSRLRRTRIPRICAGDPFASALAAVSGGRLFCDTSSSAKEVLRETSYNLTHLAQTLLEITRFDVDPSALLATTPDIISLVCHCADDAFITIKIMFHLQILPLTKQLAILGGHIWSKSLQSARAQRIEFLLLHEFHREKFIKPEKYTTRERKQMEADRQGVLVPEAPNLSKSTKKKPAYAGGLVLDPIAGLYDKFVLLLDFNSLYPSIIQEYNLCFTTVKHWQLDDEGMAALPNLNSSQPGILPRVIRTLVDRRRAVKASMKSAKHPLKRQQLDIRQQALKLVANSMYGCLGFIGSRFYCKALAALVTFQGRTILKDTVSLIETLQHRVIYGDTDSVFIATNTTDLSQAKGTCLEITKEVNKLYKTLEIESDGIFQKLLLLQKKKYVALVIVEKDGQITTKREVKGIDMVRRDWCPISKTVGQFVLDVILEGNFTRDDTIDAIHGYVRQLAEAVRAGQIPMQDFIITKGLTKALGDYPDAKSQAHVMVALQMSKAGLPVQIGDHIPYVICKIDSEKNPASRAFHPNSFSDPNFSLAIDFEWYLTNQVLPPLGRLCSHIEGTDVAHLADCLGLDSSKYKAAIGEDSQGQGLFDSAVCLRNFDDESVFQSVEKLSLSCPSCGDMHIFPGIIDMATGLSGLACPKSASPTPSPPSMAHVFQQLWSLFSRHVSRYNAKFVICSDSACSLRCPQFAGNLNCDACANPVRTEYPASALYMQLRYLISLFDISRTERKILQVNQQRARRGKGETPLQMSLSPVEQDFFDRTKFFVEQRFLRQSAYYCLEAQQVFSMFGNMAITGR